MRALAERTVATAKTTRTHCAYSHAHGSRHLACWQDGIPGDPKLRRATTNLTISAE